jgi:hypothetical protein
LILQNAIQELSTVRRWSSMVLRSMTTQNCIKEAENGLMFIIVSKGIGNHGAITPRQGD